MDLFDEIAQAKKEFPKVNSVKNKVKRYKLNFYQIFAIGMFIIFFFLGIIMGNLFSTCKVASFYSNDCAVTEFNFSLMMIIWFVSLLVSIFLFSIGHIIAVLSEINQKISKFCI